MFKGKEENQSYDVMGRGWLVCRKIGVIAINKSNNRFIEILIFNKGRCGSTDRFETA